METFSSEYLDFLAKADTIMAQDVVLRNMDGANLKNIFVSPYPTLFYRYGLVGRIFFFNFSNWIPIMLNCIQ